ncbi:hypothetical protein ACJX0J_006950, partial [Zea mays]
MTYTIVFDQYHEVSIQFVLPILLIVVIDIICNIVTIDYGCFFTNVQSIEIPAFAAYGEEMKIKIFIMYLVQKPQFLLLEYSISEFSGFLVQC